MFDVLPKSGLAIPLTTTHLFQLTFPISPMQLEDMRKNEDPRLSFSTPEFKEAQRIFTDSFKVSSWSSIPALSNYLHRLCTSFRSDYLSSIISTSTSLCLFLLQKNFGKPVEWALVKDYAWSTPQLRKLEKPVDVEGKPWPLDGNGNPILK